MKFLQIASLLVLAFLVSLGLGHFRELGLAHADGSGSAVVIDAGAPIDAGPYRTPGDVGSAAGSGATTGSALPPAVLDPASDPAGFYAQLKDAWSHSWGLALLVAMVGLLEVFALAGKKVSALAWLGTGRVSVVLGGVLAVAMTMLAAMLGSSSWSAALIAGAGALLAYWHQAGTDPAKG